MTDVIEDKIQKENVGIDGAHEKEINEKEDEMKEKIEDNKVNELVNNDNEKEDMKDSENENKRVKNENEREETKTSEGESTSVKNENENEETKENKMGNENASSKSSNEGKAAKKEDSPLDRFLNWWRGKSKAEVNLKDDSGKKPESEKEENDAKKQTEDENKEANKDTTNNELAEGQNNENTTTNELPEENQRKENTEENEDASTNVSEPEITESNTNDQIDGAKFTKSDVALSEEGEVGSSSTITDRRLEKILEEQKDVKSAPLPQEEDENIISVPRANIDPTISVVPTEAEDDGVGKDITSTTTKEVEDNSKIKTPSSAEDSTVFSSHISINLIQTSRKITIDTPSEDDGKSSKVSCGESAIEESTQHKEEEGSDQSSKMEEVIEERNQDTRHENVQEAWRRIEPSSPSKETGNKTFRVSYTIRTETVETKKQDVDDDDVKLFDDSILLNSAPTTLYEGPPPEDLEPEIVEEHAREDEAATTDIDNFFKLCKEEGSAPLAQEETELAQRETESVESVPGESVPNEPAPQESVPNESVPEEQETVPQTPEDIFKKLHSWDDEPTDWWTITKKKKEYEEWMKPMKDGTIRRVIIPCVEIPYQTSVRFITDWKHREEWDKTFSEIQVLKTEKQSKTIYCPVKKRDLTFETMDQEETDPPCHVLTWKKQNVVNDDEKNNTLTKKKKEIQLITHTCGIILRPAETGDKATKITILCQLEGPVDSVLKNTFLSGHPKTWLRNLKKYYKKHQQGDSKKVVYL